MILKTKSPIAIFAALLALMPTTSDRTTKPRNMHAPG